MDTYRLISIDPGSYHVGVTVWFLDTELQIRGIDTYIIELGNRREAIFINDIVERCDRLEKELWDILDYISPSIVSIETPFINMRTPTSVIPLARVLSSITGTIYRFNRNIKILDISPFEAKKAIHMGNTLTYKELKKKGRISELVYSNEELNRHIEGKYITEHEIDSIAVGYMTIRYIREHPLVLVSY